MRRRYNDVSAPVLRYLSDQERLQPLLVLQAFFEDCEMDQFRLDLRFWFALSCGDQQYRSMKQFAPSAMVGLHQQLMRLLEAAYLMQPHDDAEDDHGLPRVLFSFLSLSDWQDEMDVLLYYSLDDTPVADDCDNNQLYFPMYELLNELLDWVELTYEDEVQQPLADVLPEGVVVLNRNDDYFPPELILALYEYGKVHEGYISFRPCDQETKARSGGRGLLSHEFQTMVLKYLEEFPPLTTVSGLKKVYLNYLKFLLRHSSFHKDDDGSFVSHMDRLFELLQAADDELKYLN